ncbi:uncharacterized protein BO66DRAFT_387500 [Aspergillus aculeatinus CBS 121060]|uniref:Uncharacterized protein n=1 Tax=Aspergillus aculeatinus CBS 121060 TaxID=1448322 RepID=A0ACD1HPY9_9EURO|nr:hypothetical protein BO66DRAFT_387500 [Aspergillus aculeatinus CBS 121060]RAH75660.1 hypothetical protein BO66DRAFT_387500 [Aspergillus aculeatinus CBS 121060]
MGGRGIPDFNGGIGNQGLDSCANSQHPGINKPNAAAIEANMERRRGYFTTPGANECAGLLT